jgi:hypothetical protein
MTLSGLQVLSCSNCFCYSAALLGQAQSVRSIWSVSWDWFDETDQIKQKDRIDETDQFIPSAQGG